MPTVRSFINQPINQSINEKVGAKLFYSGSNRLHISLVPDVDGSWAVFLRSKRN